MPSPNRPEWDTPPNGDFASYVERLSASGAGARPVAAPSLKVGKAAAKGRLTADPQGLPPDLAQVLAPLARGLGVVRAVLLLVTLVHAAAFFGLGRGSLPGLLFTGLLWWGLGRVAAMASGAMVPGGSRPAAPGVARLQDRLAQLAKQRTTGTNK